MGVKEQRFIPTLDGCKAKSLLIRSATGCSSCPRARSPDSGIRDKRGESLEVCPQPCAASSRQRVPLGQK